MFFGPRLSPAARLRRVYRQPPAQAGTPTLMLKWKLRVKGPGGTGEHSLRCPSEMDNIPPRSVPAGISSKLESRGLSTALLSECKLCLEWSGWSKPSQILEASVS